MLPMKPTSDKRRLIVPMVQGAEGREKIKKLQKTKKTEWVLNLPKNQRAQTNSRRHPTGPPDGKPESYWVWAGCDKVLTPYMASEFRDLREAGVEDALVVAALKEAMRHQAKYPWVYAKRLLDQAAAQKITTLEAWEKSTYHNTKETGVDRGNAEWK